MLDSKCTYSFTMEVEGNKKKLENLPGIIRSGIQQKQTSVGTLSVIWVEDQESGDLREVFAHTVKVMRS